MTKSTLYLPTANRTDKKKKSNSAPPPTHVMIIALKAQNCGYGRTKKSHFFIIIIFYQALCPLR